MPNKDFTQRLSLLGEELRGIAQNGLLFCQDDYDKARYQRVQEISAELASLVSGGAPPEIVQEFARLPGYATPKVGVAAALFDEAGRMLLIQRADNKLWAMPGGWADINLSAAEVAAKEVQEETGLLCEIDRLLGVYDGHTNNFKNFYHLYHIVFQGRVVGGEVSLAPKETLAVDWFTENELPALSPGHERAIQDCFVRRSTGEAFFDPPRK